MAAIGGAGGLAAVDGIREEGIQRAPLSPPEVDHRRPLAAKDSFSAANHCAEMPTQHPLRSALCSAAAGRQGPVAGRARRSRPGRRLRAGSTAVEGQTGAPQKKSSGSGWSSRDRLGNNGEEPHLLNALNGCEKDAHDGDAECGLAEGGEEARKEDEAAARTSKPLARRVWGYVKEACKGAITRSGAFCERDRR